MKTKSITTTPIAVLAIIVATTTTATSVQASNNNDNDNGCVEKSFLAEIACEGQGILSAYNQGEKCSVKRSE